MLLSRDEEISTKFRNVDVWIVCVRRRTMSKLIFGPWMIFIVFSTCPRFRVLHDLHKKLKWRRTFNIFVTVFQNLHHCKFADTYVHLGHNMFILLPRLSREPCTWTVLENLVISRLGKQRFEILHSETPSPFR